MLNCRITKHIQPFPLPLSPSPIHPSPTNPFPHLSYPPNAHHDKARTQGQILGYDYITGKRFDVTIVILTCLSRRLLRQCFQTKQQTINLERYVKEKCVENHRHIHQLDGNYLFHYSFAFFLFFTFL